MLVSSFWRVLRRGKGDFPTGCGWEELLKCARGKKEADLLEPDEELGICIPQAEKPLDVGHLKKQDVTLINHIPCDARNLNTVIIQKRSKHCMQSGTANTHNYILSFRGGINWENPLMGWTSGDNSLRPVEISFPDIESAKSYVESNGWNYYIPPEAKEHKMPRKDYAANFSWNKRSRRSTK